MSSQRCAYCSTQIKGVVLRPDLPGLYFCDDACHRMYRLIIQQVEIPLTIDEMNLLLNLLNGPWQSEDKNIVALRDRLGGKLAPVYGQLCDMLADAELQLQKHARRKRNT